MVPRFEKPDSDTLFEIIYKFVSAATQTIVENPGIEPKLSVICAYDILKEVIKYNAVRSRPIIFCDKFSNN
jgi:hypothetical protein